MAIRLDVHLRGRDEPPQLEINDTPDNSLKIGKQLPRRVACQHAAGRHNERHGGDDLYRPGVFGQLLH